MASRSLKEKKRNGYSCSLFVQLPPDYIKCGVCWNVLRDPQLTECCGRNVCKSCIVEGGPCPLAECGTPHVKASFNRKCRNDIDDRMVYCSSKNNGCQWVDKMEKLERHLEEGGFVEEACRYCRASVQRQSIKRHEAICKQYPIKCKCGKTYERQHQSLHLKSCIYTSVKCPFNIVGCTREVLNKDLRQHLNDCLPDHYTLVAKLSQDMQAKVEATKCLIQQEYEDKISQLDSEIDGLSVAIFAAREKVATLKGALRKGEEEMGNLQRAQDTTKYHFAAQIGVGEGEIRTLKESMDRLHFDSKVNLYGQPLPRPHPIVSRSTQPTTDLLVPPLAFTIFDFPDKKKHDAVIFTPPFLTHNRGYKMCLKIYCNGDDRGKGKWLSIYAYVLRGEYDDYLLWPFCGSITIEVRNLLRNPRYNNVKTITFAPRPDSCGVRVQGEEYFAPNCLGYLNFMYLSVLFPSYNRVTYFQYIQNGCLKIDVSKIKLDQ